ncbi:restriction endonuclease subunit S [Aeromonas veronii]|uniref:restriction endonuclease subunit S n=1 Tax=Aeromonas veronii TaxID=654 RepID=UPI0024451EC1|nr:restriction endonuclease subunit S [Aeromonas veronii]
MKAGWKMKPLGEVSVINYGYTESATSDPIGPKFLRITDIQDSGVNWDDVPFCQIDATGLKKFKLAQGDIVFARTGATTGKSFLVINPPEAVFASYLIRLRLQDISLLPEFVSLYFQSKEYWDAIRAGSSGSAQGGFNASKLAALMIPVPPLPEQQRIVAILDEALAAISAARANAEQNRQNARALFESYLQSVFSQRGDGWVEKRLEEIGTTQTGSTPKSSDQSSYGNFIPFVKPGDFNPDGSLNYENGGLSETGTVTARKVQAGSALMVCIGATIGKAGFCDRAIATNQQINSFTPNELYCHKFIYYQMITHGFQQRVIHASGQATLPIINKSKWSALTVAVPPTLDEQHKIVGSLDALRNETQRLESLYQRKIAALDELKQSLLQQAFSGQL